VMREMNKLRNMNDKLFTNMERMKQSFNGGGGGFKGGGNKGGNGKNGAKRFRDDNGHNNGNGSGNGGGSRGNGGKDSRRTEDDGRQFERFKVRRGPDANNRRKEERR